MDIATGVGGSWYAGTYGVADAVNEGSVSFGKFYGCECVSSLARL